MANVWQYVQRLEDYVQRLEERVAETEKSDKAKSALINNLVNEVAELKRLRDGTAAATAPSAPASPPGATAGSAGKKWGPRLRRLQAALVIGHQFDCFFVRAKAVGVGSERGVEGDILASVDFWMGFAGHEGWREDGTFPNSAIHWLRWEWMDFFARSRCTITSRYIFEDERQQWQQEMDRRQWPSFGDLSLQMVPINVHQGQFRRNHGRDGSSIFGRFGNLFSSSGVSHVIFVVEQPTAVSRREQASDARAASMTTKKTSSERTGSLPPLPLISAQIPVILAGYFIEPSYEG
jgi:hypothetical protein